MDANRFTQKSMEALQSAQQLAQSYGNEQVEQLHLLCALVSQDNGLIGQLMEKLGISSRQAVSACESAVSRLPKISGSNQQPYVSNALGTALAQAEAERIAALEAQNETLLECLLEMSEIVYA